MANVYLVLRFDTEDFLLSDSDDAILKIISILDSFSIKGNFNITGKKVETLLKRGRKDVIKALSKHDITYHSYGHSIHPNVREYQKYMSWDEGVKEFIRRESKGIDLLDKAFGRLPNGYGQAGGTWTPHTYGAMRELNFPVFTGGSCYVRYGLAPIWYCGILQMSTLYPSGNLTSLAKAKEIHLSSYQKAKSQGRGLLNFCGHDCNFVTGEYWDEINFANGENPPESEWKMPELYPKEKQRELLSIFEEYIRYVVSFDDLKVVTPLDLTKLYEDKTKKRGFSMDELVSISKECADGIDFQKIDVGYISPSEIFSLLVSSIAAFLREGKFPSKSYVKDILGPVRRNQTDKDLSKLNNYSFLESITDTDNFIEVHGKIPSEIWVGSMTISPTDYLATLAYYLPSFIKKDIPQDISIKKGNFLSERYVQEDIIKRLWKWLDSQGKFQAPNLVELAKLQTWTLKPAVCSD